MQVMAAANRRCAEDEDVSDILVQFAELIRDEYGSPYLARACGEQMPNDTRWEGWIEFTARDGSVIASGRETTQPNRTDAEYWATGLTPVYLEGALQRALHPLRVTPRPSAPLSAPTRAATADHEGRRIRIADE
jgi:hypothetical protein